MFIVILNSFEIWVGIVKMTSEQAEVYDTKDEDDWKEFMFESSNEQVDLDDSNCQWMVYPDDALEIQILWSLQFNQAKMETKQWSLTLTIE